MTSAFGRWLVELGALPGERALDDVLARQSERLPTASVAYVLGYADERTLAAVLAAATGRPAVVLDESVVDVTLLGDGGDDDWLRTQAVPVVLDEGTVVVAAAHPDQLDLGFLAAHAGGRPLMVAAALAVTVARTIRAALAARARGERLCPGVRATVAELPVAALVGIADEPLGAAASPSDRHDAPSGVDPARAAQAVIGDSTKQLDVRALAVSDVERELDLDDELPSQVAILAPRGAAWPTDGSWSRPGSAVGLDGELAAAVDADVGDLVRSLVAGPPVVLAGTGRVLIVDDDYATRKLLAKEFEPRGYQVATAASGADAIDALRELAPDVIVADILLPGVDGFRLCRAVKQTPRLRDVAVILMSAVIESGRVTPEVLLRYAADGYAAKPLDTIRLLRIVRDLLGRRREAARVGADQALLRRALDQYERGDEAGAVAALRERLAHAPDAVRVRFALANLLQRGGDHRGAVLEYQGVVARAPDYFPALTRLAFLYYQRGDVRAAVETWRRSLPCCADADLRRNIELFVRSLSA
ncbi:MAG: response regulator [Kofleriaceae bacterium]